MFFTTVGRFYFPYWLLTFRLIKLNQFGNGPHVLGQGYLPNTWRKVKVVYIPKAVKKDPEHPKSYRPINLTSFFLKTLERLVDYHNSYILERNT